MRGKGAPRRNQGEEAGGLRVSLEGLGPHYHCRGWGWEQDTRHGLREEQEPGGRYNVGFQFQTQTCYSEFEDPKGQTGAQCRTVRHWDPREGGPRC